MARRRVVIGCWLAMLGSAVLVPPATAAASFAPARFSVKGRPLVASQKPGVGRTLSVFARPAAVSVAGCREQRPRVKVKRSTVSLSVTLTCPRVKGALRLTATIRGARLRGVLRHHRSQRRFSAVRVLPAGTLLRGRPAARALSVIRDTNRISRHPASELSSFHGGTIVRTQLVVTIARGASVGDVNAALRSVGGRIAGALAGSRVLVVYIPDPGDPGRLDGVRRLLAHRRGVARVDPGALAAEDVLPPQFSSPPTFDQTLNSNHLLVMRMPAAWNTLGATDLAIAPINPATRPTLMVADFFGNGPLDPHVDAIYNSALLTTGAPTEHGYHVVGIAAGDFADDGTKAGQVTGVFPAATVLSPIDLSGSSFAETTILILLRATAQPGHIVVNTSLGFPDFFPAPFDARTFASEWASQIRARGLENRLVQATAAGNDPKSPAVDTSEWTGSALRGDLSDPASGQPILPLQNTLVVENDFGGGPPDWQPGCINPSSSKGGTIAADGSSVYSDLLGSDAGILTGTSMASPQIAALAEYLWSVAPDLTAPQIVHVIEATARPARSCQSAPAADAYAAVLALDHPGPQTPANDPVRLALFDVNNDRRFDEHDLAGLAANVLPSTPPSTQDWSRDDLNGDGFTGGSTTSAFDLDTARSLRGEAPNLSTVTETIDGSPVTFDERASTDQDVLCYYAYSPLYTGDPHARDALLANTCVGPKLLFQGPGTSSGTTSVYTINADGGGETQLTTNPFSDGDPAWSPDRKQIVYASTASGFTDLRVMNADGSNQHAIRDGSTGVTGSGQSPAWSPDGKEIAYVCGCGQLRAISPTGTGDHLIWEPVGTFGHEILGGSRLTYSPDSSRLVVAIRPGGPTVDELWSVGRTGGSPTRLTTGALDKSPEFSPDGKKIVFERITGAHDAIWSMNADGSGQTPLTSGGTDTSPEFSPDGRKIVFARVVNSAFRLFTMNADGSNPQPLPTTGSASWPAWSQ